MKTLFVTCIYNDLYDSTIHGRSGRYFHYLQSLKSIMKMNPDKVICFTSEKELEDLVVYFKDYSQIQFIVSELSDMKYHDKIAEWKTKKNLDYKAMQRNFHIQYNKFLWINDIKKEVKNFDKVYWIDAGLSQEHLFMPYYVPKDGYFEISLFNKDLMERFHEWSEKKCFVLGKYNRDRFYWSPSKNPEWDYHVIGGSFGGDSKKFTSMCKKFAKILHEAIEEDLYMEEQIMTQMFYKHPRTFNMITFDDWIDRDWHEADERDVKVFYQLFE